MADAVIAHLNPIRLRIKEYLRNPDYLVEVLKAGGEKSSAVAQRTIDEVKEKVGIGLPQRLSMLLEHNS